MYVYRVQGTLTALVRYPGVGGSRRSMLRGTADHARPGQNE